ncbi:MAG: hypothetical protein EBY80_16935, partial [Actinobacteria bacterium]|nr:hypothetical protein [Actinomycetota bacterium]
MFNMAATSDEDRLDRVQTLRTLRRTYDMATPQRRTLHAALGLVLLSTLVTLAGPTLLRFAIDHGIKEGDGRVLNWLIGVYLVVTAFGYVVGRMQYLAVNRAG